MLKVSETPSQTHRRVPREKRSSTAENITFRCTKQSTIVKVLLTVINIDTLVIVRRSSTKRSNVRAMHIRPNTRKKEMNRAADDVVTPSLVESAERLELQIRDARKRAGVLLVFSCTQFLDPRAEGYLCDLLERKIVEVDSYCSCGPGLQVWDPRVVFEHFAFVVEAPERYLEACISREQQYWSILCLIVPGSMCSWAWSCQSHQSSY